MAYCAFARAGGPGRRNCHGVAIVKGATFAQCGSSAGQLPTARTESAIGGFEGTGLGWGRHFPGAVPGLYCDEALEPSTLRAASMAAAAACPTEMPRFSSA